MSDTTVLAAIISGIVAVVVALVGAFVKIADAASTKALKATENTRGDIDQLRAEIAQLRSDAEQMQAAKRAQDLRLEKVEGIARDQSELIDDMLEIILWVEHGAKPPIPALSWRIRQMMLRRQSPQTQTE